MLKHAVELLTPDTEVVKTALIQIHEKKKRDKEKKDQLSNGDPDMDVDELLETYKAKDDEMIKEKDWKMASYNLPLEIHIQLIRFCFECNLWEEFETLLDSALIRLKFRRYEIPYLATIDVLMSASKEANIPNGFDKLPKDLNSANLRIELKKLRQAAKKNKGGDPPEGGDAKKPPVDKKKGKDAK